MAGIVDVHHHLIPPAYLGEIGSGRLLATSRKSLRLPLDWTPDLSIEEMDEAGVATAILSLSDPGIWFGDRTQTRRLARAVNEYGARMVANRPGRFGLFATLPLPSVDDSFAELDFAMGPLAADGIGLFTSYGDRWLGDPLFAPLFAELDRREAVVYVHPVGHAGTNHLVPGLPAAAVEFLHNMTRAICSLLLNGILSRHRRIRFIFSHLGGTAPYLAHRIASFFSDPEIGAQVDGRVEDLLASVYFDAVAAPAQQLAAMNAVTSAGRLLFGSDFPYGPGMMKRTLDRLAAAPMSAEDRGRILCGNAAALFPRLAL